MNVVQSSRNCIYEIKKYENFALYICSFRSKTTDEYDFIAR